MLRKYVLILAADLWSNGKAIYPWPLHISAKRSYFKILYRTLVSLAVGCGNLAKNLDRTSVIMLD